MDNDDALLKLVLKDDEYKELPNKLAELNLTTIDAGQYLRQLSSSGYRKLANEINRITDEKTSIVNQTQELAFQEYPTFIETAQCTQEIFHNFQKVNQSTEKLISGLTTLKEKCGEFSKTAQSLSTARRLTSLALSKHTQLLEVLELPQLMDTCVRNGYWEEALDLATYVARLERKLGYIPLIVKVAQEVKSCTRLMLSQLIAQLRMPAQLPHCLKVVSYLRRMNVFSEEEMRLKFLQARDTWFKSTLEEIPKEDAYQHVIKVVELSRVHLFDIATQYRAIFTDEDPLVLANQDPNTNESAIYCSWIIEKITDFLASLQSDLPRVPPSSLESVFGQCMYFGLSFGRIGSDFRSLLVPIFSQVAYDRFDQATNKCEAQFAESMASFSLARTGISISPSLMQGSPTTAEQVQPPFTLLKFTPLSELCNGLIAAFNDLRLCAPIEVVDRVVRKLEQTLSNCSQIIADFHRQEKGAFTTQEELEFTKCVQLYRSDFLSYIQKVLQLMFPATLLSAQTGFQPGEITKQDPTYIDKNSILRSIEHLLVVEEPVKLPALSDEDLQKLQIPTTDQESTTLTTPESSMNNGIISEEITSTLTEQPTEQPAEVVEEPSAIPSLDNEICTENSNLPSTDADTAVESELEAGLTGLTISEQEVSLEQKSEPTRDPNEEPIKNPEAHPDCQTQSNNESITDAEVSPSSNGIEPPPPTVEQQDKVS